MSDTLKSFGLKTRSRADGRVELVGKQDDGKEYVAHVAKGSEVTPDDIQYLADCDREQNTAKSVVDRQIERQRVQAVGENPTLDEWEEAALPVAEAGLGVAKLGYSRRYSKAFERINW